MSQERLKKYSFIIILIFSVLIFSIKISMILSSSGYISYDGAFYSDIALHVYEGKGLLTSNSSFDQFYKILPRPAQVYPFWPLVGGIFAHLLPNSIKFVLKLDIINLIFSIFSIYVLYFLIINLLDKYNNEIKYFLAVSFTISFNFMATYFYYTIKPYTESLTILLILSSLLMFFKIIDNKNSKLLSLLFGLLLFLSFFTRSQSSIFIFVVFIFSIYFLYKKDILFKNFLIIWGSSFIFVIFYFYYLYTIRADHFNFMSLLFFQDNYELSKYIPLPHTTNNSILFKIYYGMKAFLTISYTGGINNSGILIYLLPLTLFKFKNYNIKLKLIITIGAFYLLSLFSMEMTITLRWLFGHRHGILVIFLTMFSLMGLFLFIYDNKNSKFSTRGLLTILLILLSISNISSFYVRKQLRPMPKKRIFSHKIVKQTYDFLKSEEKRLKRKIKIISLNSRSIVLFSRALGYFFDSRRKNWKKYLIYKMKYLNIDYFIINKYYDYFTLDKKVDYFTIMKTNTPKEFKLIKKFKDNKVDNWIGIYSLK